jgi:hypothetical protein
MMDENIIGGIRAWLMVERCNEEEIRLATECINLRAWCCKQWESITTALGKYSHPDIAYPLKRRRDALLMLVSEWKPLVSPISDSGASWGPSDRDLATWKRHHQTSLIKLAPFQPLNQSVQQDQEDIEASSESELGEADYLLETIDDFYLGELYGGDEHFGDDEHYGDDGVSTIWEYVEM